MFDNMKQSEKIMAGAIGCLLPIGLFFMGYVWYSSEYDTRRTRLDNIEKQVQDQKLRRLDATNANLRRNYYYVKKSLPSNHAQASVMYRDWMSGLIDECKLGSPVIGTPEKSLIRYTDGAVSTIANRYRFTISTRGTLDELIKFCYKFEELDLLQKISELTIVPIREKEALTNEHRINMKIEVLSLLDADAERDFLAGSDPPEVNLAEYENTILTRNIFGPANNPPRLSLRNKTYELGEEFSITLLGKDPDSTDELTYELVENGGMEGLEIVADRRGAKLKGVAKELGKNKVVISVTDNGFPQKSATDDFYIEVEPVKVVETKKEEPKPPPEPPFQYATQTQIKRISARISPDNPDPVFEVRIEAMPLGQEFNLGEGGEFELDDKIWVVKKIGVRTLTIVVDGKQLEFQKGDLLSNPRSETELETAQAPEVSKVTD